MKGKGEDAAKKTNGRKRAVSIGSSGGEDMENDFTLQPLYRSSKRKRENSAGSSTASKKQSSEAKKCPICFRYPPRVKFSCPFVQKASACRDARIHTLHTHTRTHTHARARVYVCARVCV